MMSPTTVEVDESWFGKKAKYHHGTSRQTSLVFGIVERKGTKCIFYLVASNSHADLLPLIKKHIDTTVDIFHDGLATYGNLATEGYRHFEVNHSLEFSTPEGIHTNTIEGLWGLVKQRISRMHGLKSYDRLAAHLDEFSYRQIYSNGGNILTKFFSHCESKLASQVENID